MCSEQHQVNMVLALMMRNIMFLNGSFSVLYLNPNVFIDT